MDELDQNQGTVCVMDASVTVPEQKPDQQKVNWQALQALAGRVAQLEEHHQVLHQAIEELSRLYHDAMPPIRTSGPDRITEKPEPPAGMRFEAGSVSDFLKYVEDLVHWHSQH